MNTRLGRRQFLASSALTLVAGQSPLIDKPIGINLASVIDWSSELPFLDAFKTSRPWMEKGTGPFTYDDRGNPLLKLGQQVETFVFRDIGGHYPKGAYVCTYDGTGEVEINQFDIDAVSQQKNKIVFRVRRPTDGGIFIKVLSSKSTDPIRNLSVQQAGLEKSDSRFNPLFIQRLKPFSVVRFMDWGQTNNSPLVDWSQRPRVTDARWSTPTGVPVEVMIELANEVGADPWFCIPHQADDEYVRGFARLVKESLQAKRKAYVEYSNEVWNWGFEQAKYADQRGKKLKLGNPDHVRYYAKRASEMLSICKEVIGGPDRLVRVLSGQFANLWGSEEALKSADASRNADAFAVGAYFGYEFGAAKSAAEIGKLNVEQLIDRCKTELDGSFRETLNQQANLAKRYGLKLLAYEGGQHLVGIGEAANYEPLTKLFHAVNRHSGMYELYRRLLQHWFDAGGGVFAAFNSVGIPSKWGSWGALEYQDQPTEQAPKYRALAEFAKENGG